MFLKQENSPGQPWCASGGFRILKLGPQALTFLERRGREEGKGPWKEAVRPEGWVWPGWCRLPQRPLSKGLPLTSRVRGPPGFTTASGKGVLAFVCPKFLNDRYGGDSRR